MRWFVLAVSLFAALWGFLAYCTAVALLRSASGARAYATLAALAAAAATALLFVRAPRPEPRAIALPLQPGRAVSCDRRPVPAHGAGRGALDTVRASGEPVADGATIDARTTLVLTGWAADVTAAHPLTAVCLIVDGAFARAQRASYGIERPDVATAYNLPAIAGSGFEIRLESGALARGTHAIDVVGIDAANRVVQIAPVRRLTVR